MWGFLGRRVLHSIWVLAAIIIVSFLVIRLIPGDPVVQMLGLQATPENIAAVNEDLGLDLPMGQQITSFVQRAFQGDLGTSIIKRAPVNDIVFDRLLPSVYLLLYATVLALIISVPLGALSAIYRNRVPDQIVRLTSMVSFAMPQFWLGLMLILLFAIQLDVLPSGGYGEGFGGILLHLTLPALTIGLYLAPQLMRTLRSSLIEAIDSDYVEAARSRGYRESRVVGKLAMRNALVPLISVLSINIGFLISGTVIVEVVFQVPGLGALLVQSVLNRDYPVIQGLILVFGAMVILVNILADAAYAVVDPRVRAGMAAE
ncbi:MAG: ABC transporter permease [bacterium]|nr:ABC transporter permease [bacterium]MXV91521.1 ABC transporter permease [Acidimicrobiia bacterium]MYC45982.1 ABC transporter permease [Acidimicrobiia bacterium]MYI20888.1 ABC transporter permease [Acidimicrobiia bacterium]